MHVYGWEREAKGLRSTQEEVDKYIEEERSTYKEERYMVDQSVLYGPYAREAVKTDSFDEPTNFYLNCY